MKNLKSERDRLSELPEPLIFHIFWFMPLKDVVRTTILSKRWNKLWTTTPFFNIDYEEGDPHAIRNFVNRAIILWEGMNIQKFKIDFRGLFGKLFFSDLDIWLCFALGKKVQELYLIFDEDYQFDSYTVPQYIYSCSWLNVLSLSDCHIKVNSNVQWSQLRSLKLDGYDTTASAIEQVLRGSPQLEVFMFAILLIDENWNIQSDSLKRLSIENRSCADDPWDDRAELRIWTPNLETLKITGVPFSKCLLMNVSSLSEVSIGFGGAFYGGDSYESGFIGKALKRMIPTIQHVEKVILSYSCIEVLGHLKLKDLLPSLTNVKFLKLKLNHTTVSPEYIVPVLKIFPRVRMLVLKGVFDRFVEPLELCACIPEFFLHDLRSVEITWNKYEKLNFPFIQFVLRFAIKLEKMIVRPVPPTPPPDSLLLASRELLRMPRASPTAELILC